MVTGQPKLPFIETAIYLRKFLEGQVQFIFGESPEKISKSMI